MVSQTRYQNVRDDYAVYFFKESAESPVLALCEEKDYLRKKTAALEMPETAATWSAEDGLERFLSESGAYVRLTLYLEDDLDHELYAEQILDFLNSVDRLECNLFLQVRANKTYLFFSEINARDGFDVGEYTVGTLVKRIKQRLKTGDPR